MGHDLKQFKSIEGEVLNIITSPFHDLLVSGFLESGPQFVLQSYILLIGQKKDTNIDFNDIRKEDATRLAVLSLSVLVSFVSLVKTAVQVNVPDPDDRRTDKQYKKNVPHFKVSLCFFTFFCVLFRLLRFWHFLKVGNILNISLFQSLLLLCLPEAVDTDPRVLRICLQPVCSLLCGSLLHHNNNTRSNLHFRSQRLPPI